MATGPGPHDEWEWDDFDRFADNEREWLNEARAMDTDTTREMPATIEGGI